MGVYLSLNSATMSLDRAAAGQPNPGCFVFFGISHLGILLECEDHNEKYFLIK